MRNYPTNAILIPHGGGEATFSWTPQSGEDGVYYVDLFTYLLSDTTWRTVTLEVNPVSPVAAFIADPKVGYWPLTVNFYDNSTGTYDRTQWSFGDGSTGFSPNPTHTYNLPGTYTVSLTVTNTNSIPWLQDTETKTNYIEVMNPPPVLDPIGNKSGFVGVEIQFPVSASDSDGTIPRLSTSLPPPDGAFFFDNDDGTGFFTFTPIVPEVYQIWFVATESASGPFDPQADSELVIITVHESCGIDVTSPVATDVWQAGESQQITWTLIGSDCDPGNTVQIDLYRAGDKLLTIAPGADNSGTYDWIVTDGGQGLSSQYHIRIIDNWNEYFSSSPYFTITAEAPPRTVNWVNINGGDWSDGSKWDVGAPPREDDTAVIEVEGSYMVTLDVNATVSTLILGGASGKQDLYYYDRILIVNDSLLVHGTGQLSIESAWLFIHGSAVVGLSGHLKAWSHNFYSFLHIDSDTLTLNGFAELQSVDCSGDGLVYNHGSLELSKVNFVGLYLRNAGDMTVTGDVNINQGYFGEVFVNEESARMRIMGDDPSTGTGNGHFSTRGEFSNYGVVELGSNSLGASATLSASKLINQDGGRVTILADQLGGDRLIQACLENAGVVRFERGATVSLDSIHENKGTGVIEFASADDTVRFVGQEFNNYGTLTGNGIIDVEQVTFRNLGVVTPGGDQIGRFTFLGGFQQVAGATLQCDISGPTIDKYDHISSNGTMALGGALSLSLINNYVPAVGDSINLMWTSSNLDNASDFESVGPLTFGDVVFEAHKSVRTYYLICTESSNSPPVLESIVNQEIAEHSLLTFIVSATDIDDDQITYAMESIGNPILPSGAQFNTETGEFDWTPSYDDSGTYTVRFIASDGQLADTATITITINNVNRAPVISAIEAPSSGDEGEEIRFDVFASDADADEITLAMVTHPQNAQFTFIAGDTMGVFSWTPGYDDAGVHSVEFTTSDGSLEDSESISITVNNVNRKPFIYPIDIPTDNNENVLITFEVHAGDPDQDVITLTMPTFPAGALFSFVPGDTMGVFSWTPGSDDSGHHWVTFRVADLSSNVSTSRQIAVGDVDQIPVLTLIGDREIDEGDVLSFEVVSSDEDDATVNLRMDGDIPQSAEFVTGDSTGLFTWATGFEDSGEYQVTFFAEDVDDPSLAVSETILLTVYNTNRPPEISPIPSEDTAHVYVLFSLTVSARDPDGEVPDLYTADLPGTATFEVNFDDTSAIGTFNWTPGLGDVGEYSITFYTADQWEAEDSGELLLHVIDTVDHNVNQRPIFTAVCPDASLEEDQPFQCQLVAQDPDGDALKISWNAIPADAEFVDNGDGTADFTFEPNYRHVDETFDVAFEVTDGLLEATNALTIDVYNRPLEVQIRTGAGDDLLINESILLKFNEPVQPDSLYKYIGWNSAKASTLGYSYDASDHLVTIHSAVGDLIPLDTILVTLDVGLCDLAYHRIEQAYQKEYKVGPVVYPGDANDDGTVDERDVLPLGLYWGNRGPGRNANTDMVWELSPARVNHNDSSWSPMNGVYCDANGSGRIEANDICAITTNWSSSQFVSKDDIASTGDLAATLALVDQGILHALYQAVIDCPESAGKNTLRESLLALLDAHPTEAVLPTGVELYQNYPNPFNPYTTIRFFLPKSGSVNLSIWNIAGQKVRTLCACQMPSGYTEVVWSGEDDGGDIVASGVYLSRLVVGDRVEVRKMTLMK